MVNDRIVKVPLSLWQLAPNACVHSWLTLPGCAVCMFEQFRLSQFASNCRFCEANNTTLFVCDGGAAGGQQMWSADGFSHLIRRIVEREWMRHSVASPLDLCAFCVIGAKRLPAELSQFEPFPEPSANRVLTLMLLIIK